MTLTHNERLSRLRLIRSETIGPITFYKLLSRFGSAQKALEVLPTLAQRGGKKTSPKIMTVDEVSAEISEVKNHGARMVIFGDEDYPSWLSTVEDAPPVLTIMGDAKYMSKPCLGIVGARNASANAKRLTHQLVVELGQKGQVIVSGMARGIDTAAHVASLNTGTVAVLAGGIDQIYPTENTELYAQIATQGCVISEMPFGTKPTAHHFPRRNRIVSALSKGVLVVEASVKSGSLITARLAGEQGREVFAIPGFPGDPRAAGPNSLIQNGAKLVQNADDILEELMAMDEKSIQPHRFNNIAEEYDDFDDTAVRDNTPDNAHEIIMQNLSASPMDVDEVSRQAIIPIQSIQMILLEMELAGIVTRHPGNRVSKVAK